MTHRATPRFWRCYRSLPKEIRDLADRCYTLLKADPGHPSLHFKKIGVLWSARVDLHSDWQCREVLLKLDVLVCGQQHVGSFSGLAQQSHVRQTGPGFIANGRDLVPDQREAERARQRLIEEDAHETAVGRRRFQGRPRPARG